MKIKSYSLFLLLASLFAFSSCEKYFGDVNIDPDAPIVAGPKTLLPVIEGRLAYTFGGDFSRFGSIFSKQIDGNNRQFATFQTYQFINSDFNSMWSNVYSGTLMDIQQLKKVSDANGYAYYAGIARVLEAYTLLMATDVWGDLPYTEAFQGTANLQPKYDSQEAIYATIQTLLTDARTNLAKPKTTTVLPASDDLIYGGSTALWTKFANVLSAKAYLHLSNVAATNVSKAVTELAKGGFASAAEEPRFPFTAATTGASPWFQYLDQRGDTENGARYIALLDSFADPRKPFYGDPDLYNTYLYISERPLALLSYTEQKFIEAEAVLRTSTAAAATPAYLAAIKSSFNNDIGVDSISTRYNAYILNPKVVPTAGITLAQVITQKYIALWTNMETWTDWRRTGFPYLAPTSGTQVPRRMLYPQSEVDLNTKTPKVTTLFERMWWDK